ncbi:S8 family peptidase [Thermomonospora sp. CIF 1]|nr:S8 family peptidase [Thermomonospora sp. CIF 1]
MAVFASASLALVPFLTAAPSASAAAQTGGYIVVLKDGAEPSSVAAEQTKARGGTLRHVYRSALKGYSARLTAAAAARLAKDPRVQSVEPDREVSITAQTLPTGINRIDAELSPTAKINGIDERVDVDVAVIDTGIQLNHPDLNVYTAGARNCSTGSSANDGNGHGTHVAGTIGALDNNIGVVGVAPGARLWPVRVLNNSGNGTWSQIICGVDYVTAHANEIEVANMSLGGTGTEGTSCSSSSLRQAICNSVNAGVTYVVAAGNSYANANGFVPATYPEVITVSALADFNGAPGGGASPTCRSDQDDTFADFSNYGSDVDLIAPGVCIYSTYIGSSYATLSGTSMASPHVAGAAALYKATHPSASPAAVKAALQSAGNYGWIWPSQDPDGIQEKLLNVSTF